MPKIYLDNAAAAPIAPEVQKEMVRAMKLTGNPSSFNDAGRRSAEELKKARLVIARFLGAHPEEIIFTSSGSEANNMATMCPAFIAPKMRDEIIITPIEHPSVLEPAKFLRHEGKKILYVKVDRNGMVDVDDLVSKVSDKTLLVSVMYANNEIGTIEPIIKVGKMIKSRKGKDGLPLFHVDACQAAGYLNMNVNSLGVDLLTFNGSKIYGPRGIGVL